MTMREAGCGDAFPAGCVWGEELGLLRALGRVTCRLVIEAVSEAARIGVRDIVEPGRFRHLVTARHAAVWLTKRLVRGSFRRVALEFGGRHPSTIVNSYRAVERDYGRFADVIEGAVVSIRRRVGT